MANTQEIEALAAEIGENIYIEVAKWHLYLSDAHLHTIVAERVYPLIEDAQITEQGVAKIIGEIKVPLGGGKIDVSLVDLLPAKCQKNLTDILLDFEKNR